MAVAQGPFLAAVLLLVSRLHCSSPLPACPESCTCQSTPLLNCSSAGLSFVPQQIQDSVTDLDLSHNLLDSVTLYRPHRSLRNVWLGNNSITRLSLCVERSIRGRHVHRLRPQSRRGCVSWAPTLQLLSVERNQLEQLPQGLEGSESLQVLQLSFNRISTLRAGDLSHLRQLKELHLQHNLITSLHPQMFQDLAQLQVLDLSFNMLTSLHPLTYFSLRHIGVDVQLGGNSWQCDCSMRSLRRRMAYDSSRGLQAWSVVCATPSIISGRDLLQVEEHDLNCFSAEDGPEVHRDVTVYSGSEILLSCSIQDSTWWTPSGQASVSQPQAGLLISDVTERDAGLYVCVSEEHEVVSVFNLQISKIGGARRKARSLPRTSQEIIPQDTPDRIGQERNPRATQSDLALAVCLSVFITFLIAFILGVLARPCIDVLWGRITKKKSTSATHSVSSVEQRQYDNEAYCDGEEPEQTGAHRERRVTFSTVDYGEDRNVQYYDTVAGVNQETINNEAVIECEVRNTNTAGDSGSENSVRLSITEDYQRDSTVLSGGHTHSIEFEHIPDPVEQEKRRSSSSCSDSSQSDKVFNKDQMTLKATTKSHQLAEDSSTDIRVEVSQISVEGTSKLPGFSSEPFADWSPHTNDTNFTDPELLQENEEQFEFSDSVHSSSVRSSSVRGSFNDSKLILLPTSDKQRTDDSSSSSSYVSENEPTQYTVNSDLEEEEEEDKERNLNKVTNASLKQGVSFEQQIQSVDSIRPTVRFNQDDYSYDKQRPVVRPEDSFSSHSGDSDVEDYTVKTGHVPTLAVTSHSKSLDTGAPSPSAAYPSSSSSDSEAEIKDLKMEHSTGRLNEGIKINKAETLSTDWDRISIPQVKRRADIKTPLPASDSSSSDESLDETTKHTKKQEQGEVNMAGQSVTHDAMKPQCPALDPAPATTIKRRAPLPPIDSSSDESANKTMEQKQKQGETQMMRPPIKVSQTPSRDSDIQWPALNLEDTTRVKRRLDIKAPSPPDSSSSSESEDETAKHIKRQEQEQMNTARPPSKVSETAHYNPQTQWPLLDLQHTKHIKRRLDIKAPSPDSDSSSSSDSEDETTHHIQMSGKVEIAGLPLQESQTGSHHPSTMFPSIDLEHIPHIKRRLDIKAPSPPPDSSSSSDSEGETTHHIQRPGNVEITGLPFQESQTKSHNPDTRWPALDLEQTMHIKRRLDIKAPSPPPDSSSSSDSEDETINHMNKQEQGQMNTARPPSKVSETAHYNPQTQWPLLDLQHTKHIKRRLDVKAPSPDSDSSSSSDSEDEMTHHTEMSGKVEITGLPLQESQTGIHHPSTMFPSIDLEHIPHIKRRLDIKAPSPPPDSSSSSNSGDETTHHIQRPGKVEITGLPFKESQTESHDPDTRWPALDLEQTMHIKRRLDIKAPSPPPDSSSSSDSEDETINHMNKQEQGQMNTARPPSKVSETAHYNPQTQWPLLDLQHTKHIKRRLDVKAPSPDSSSSSDSEDEMTHHTEMSGKVEITGLPLQESQTGIHHPSTMFPSIDLEHIPHIKRRLDIKAPSPPPDSSSSSNSEDETTHHIQRPGNVEITGLPFKESQTESHDPDTRWPALDLEHIPRIKRRLDIKAPSPPPDSSSSSDSEDETINHMNKQKQGQMNMARPPSKVSETAHYNPQTQWPLLDLQHTKHIKRRLDIKAPSPESDSSSSSDSEDETTHHIQRPGKVEITGLPFKESQTESHDPDTRWPALDLEHILHIKRRLDIKAPSPPPDSSSSSNSEDETTHHIQRPGKVEITGLPFKESQTESHDPDTRWPALDLEHIPRIKRRLDIKAPSPPPDSSSSSDSEDETINHMNKQKQGQMNMARPPSKVSETAHYNPQTQWPLLDLQHTKHIKRRLDVKAPSPDSDSSSGSDSEDETSGHNKKQRPAGVDIAVPSFEKSQTGSHDPGTVFPSIDLEHIPHIKRRLDIKAPSPPLEPPSSCEIVEKHEQSKVHISRHPSQGSQAESCDPDTPWPVVDLEHTVRVKRRLDIKAPPPSSRSSSSSDTEDETTHQVKKEEQGETHMARPPITVSQTVSYDPQTQWPLLNLEHTKHVKRRLDVKAPSPYTDSSSSSDSEDETTHHTERPRKVAFAELPLQKSQTINQDPESQWPALDLEPNLRIKRRLDIKAPSPVSDSSSSSDSEDETTHSTKTARPAVVGVVGPPFQESQTVSRDPETQWPTVDLSNITRIKRRLDIKAPSPPPDSLLSGGSTNHTMEGKREEAIKISPGHSSGSSDEDEKSIESLRYPPPTVKPDSRWPTLDLNSDLHVKRRLDIRARSPPSESSSSSDESESGTTNPPKTDVGITSHRPEGKMPDLKVNVPPVKRRLNIKAPSAQPDPVLSSVSPSSRQSESYSSRSNSEDESRGQAKAGLGVSASLKTMEKEFITAPKTPLINISHRPKADHNIKLEKYTVVTDDVGVKTSDNISRPQEINPELQSRWATMDLGISRFRKRLEITSQTREPPNLPSSPLPDSPSSSSSESGTGSKSSKTRQGVGIQGIVHAESSVTTKNEVQRQAGTELRSQTSVESHSVHSHLSLTNIPHVKRTLDIRAPLQRESSSSSSGEDETIAHSVPDLSLGVPRVKRRLDIKAPSPEPSNSSSSESENDVTRNTINQNRHPTNMSGMIDNDHLITYKRLIMKPSSPLGNSFTPSGMDQTIDHTKQRYTGTEIVTVTRGGPFHSVGDRDAPLSPKKVPSMSFDDVVKKRLEQSRSTTDLDVPPEIRWTGVGRQLSDRSLPGPRTHLDVGVSSPQQAPPAKPESPAPDSSSSDSDDNIKQDKGKADVTLTYKHSSLSASGVSLASSRAFDKFDSPPSSTSELLRALSGDTNKRKGLGALKAMSTERQKWDTVDGNLDKGASSTFDDTSFNYRRSEEDVKPLAKQPLPQLSLSSTSVDERRAKDLLYDIPRYRRHDMGDTEPPQRDPPPVPATPPPPYEAVGLSRRFPQSSTAQGLQSTRSYLQQSRTTEESTSSSVTSQNLTVYFDSSNVNISEV